MPVLFLSLLLCCSRPVWAIDRLALSLGDIRGEGWEARGVTAELVLDTAAPSAVLNIERLRLSAVPDETLSDISIHCPVLETGPRWRCHRGSLKAAPWRGQALAGRVEAEFDPATGALALKLEGLSLAGGQLSLSVRGDARSWTLALGGQDMDAAQAGVLAQVLGIGLPYEVRGRLDFRVLVAGRGTKARKLTLSLQAREFAFSDATGRQAGEDMTTTLKARIERKAQRWEVSLDADLKGGFLYLEPVGLDLERWPARLQGTLALEQKGGLVIERLLWDQPGVLKLSVRGRVEPGVQAAVAAANRLAWPQNVQRLMASVPELELKVEEARLPGAYESLLQPWLYGTPAGELEARGLFSARLQVREGRLAGLALALEDVDLRDGENRFEVRGLSGSLAWAPDAMERRAWIRWSGASFYRLGLGGARLEFKGKDSQFVLAESAEVPVLDGSLSIDSLAFEKPGLPDMRWHFDAVLTPVSMPALTRALGWPQMAGRLSGVIPHVNYAGGELSVGGVLLINVFDGDITVRGLRLLRPFGRVPELMADVRVKGIELERLTRTFEFGKIEGRLDGRIQGLRLQNWKPVAFDARFETPPGDRSRHRISQRAIDNLTSIGGGVGGALSRSYLRFFEEFPYDRLGIACRLVNGVCRMDGVAPAPQGYYLVKGRWLPPRIDIVGYNRRVDWAALVARVKAAIETGGPSIRQESSDQ